MEVLKSVGINTALKGLIIFLGYGFLTTIFIAFFYGLDSDLPDAVIATLEGPISIYTFGWLSLFGLLSLVIATKFGKRVCNFNTNRPKIVFWFALPICEAAIAIGVVIGGTLLGVALCAHLLFSLSWVDIELHPKLYGISAFMFLITYPVAYFTLALIDTEKTIYFWLNATAILYTLFVVVLFCFTLPIKDATTVGVLAVIAIIGYAIYAYQKQP